MADSKLTALTDVGALADTDTIYVVRGATSYKSTIGAVKAQIAYIEGEVDIYSSLPVTAGTPAINSAYLVRGSEGLWLINRKPAGVYIRTANNGVLADWTYAGEFPDVFSDANFQVYDDADNTKLLKLQLSGITTGATRTLTVPDASGTIMLVGDAPASHTHPQSEVTNLVTDLAGKAASSHTHAYSSLTGIPSTFAPVIGAGAGDAVAGNDSRLTDARTPTSHNHAATDINSGTLDGDRLPGLSTTKKGGVPATGTPSGKYLKDDGTWDAPAGGGTQYKVITAVFDGGGSVITSNSKCYVRIPWACTITKVTTLADQSGSAVVDVWKDTYANYPPTVADTIAAAAKPTLSTATKSEDSTLTGWTTAIAAGDVLGFNVDSCTTITRLVVEIEVTL